MNILQFRCDTTDDQLTLRPFIDGIDLLAGHRNSQGRDPDVLLPPLSTALLPTGASRGLILGVCSCGETGCGSLTLTLRRVKDAVVWEPGGDGETLTRSYQFDLVQYLDAIDAAAGDRAWGEGRGRRVARTVRVMLGSYYGKFESLSMFHSANLDWIGAWPWTSDVVKASVSNHEGQKVYEFVAAADESDAEFAARVATEINQMLLPRTS